MDRLTSMSVFVRAVDRGGFAAAADELDISPAMVGLHVRALEDRLGARLLNRTTRRQSLTEIGRDYYERCKRILASVADAEQSADALTAAPRGLLRISAPVSFGGHALAPALAAYMALYPEVEVELTVGDRVVDLVDEGFDVAIRVGALPDSSLIARRLTPYRLVVCAAPAYLTRRGEPRTPADLAGHACLGLSQAPGGPNWRFEGPDGPVEVTVSMAFRANHGEALKGAAIAGLGVVLQPEVLLAGEIAAGRLTRLLADYPLPARPMHILYPPDRRPTPKLRTFVDFIAARFPP